MQSGEKGLDKSITAVGKAAATALKHAVQGLRAGHVLAAGAGTKALARGPVALYGALFVFRALVDAEARATCSAFGAPCTAAALLRGPSAGAALRRTAEKVVRRAFGPRTKDEGHVLSVPPSSSTDDDSKEEKNKEEKEEEETPKEEEHKEQEEERDELVPNLDLEELVRETEAVFAGVREGVREACEGVRAARVVDAGAAHEKSRAEMRARREAERARLDAVLAAACEDIDRDAERDAAELRRRHGTRVANAARAVADADGAIIADANANPLAEPQPEKKPDEKPVEKPEADAK